MSSGTSPATGFRRKHPVSQQIADRTVRVRHTTPAGGESLLLAEIFGEIQRVLGTHLNLGSHIASVEVVR